MTIDDKQITITFRIYPYCNHQEFEPTCLWCADAQRVYKKLLEIQREYSVQRTKVAVVDSNNPVRE
jgi:hypothetical protein